MADITRPPKTFGTTSYRTEVLANAPNDTIIKATEVDADLDLLYATINNLDDANIAIGANIHGSKIQAGTLPAATIAANSITNTQINVAANIVGSKLAAGTITARELAGNAVVRGQVVGVPAASLDLTGAADLVAVTFPAITLHGNSLVLIFGSWSLQLFQTLAGGLPVYDVKIKRSGTEAYRMIGQGSIMSGELPAIWTPLPVPTFLEFVGPVGAVTYTITYATGGAGTHIISPGDPRTGQLYVVELAGGP